jgi:hypothetical protein
MLYKVSSLSSRCGTDDDSAYGTFGMLLHAHCLENATGQRQWRDDEGEAQLMAPDAGSSLLVASQSKIHEY